MGVLSLPHDLAVTVAMLDASSDPKVTSRRIRWESMERVLRLLRGSFKESDTNALAVRELDIARFAWTWARVCMDGPVPPAHACTGIARLREELDEGIAALGTSRLIRLTQAVEQVAAGTHPAADTVAALVNATQGDVASVHEHPCVLIVRGEGREGVRDWCDSLGLDADVATVSQARRAMPWRHAIVFGPPDRYTSSPWVAGSQASATAGWLLTAPSAPTVTVLSWTGHRPLDKSGYQPWQGAPQSTVTESSTVEVVEDDFLPDSLDTFRPVAAPTFNHDEEMVNAFGLQFLVEGTTVLGYFHPEVGPKPAIVTFEDNHAVVTRSPLRVVREGRCLLFRTTVAGKDALDRATVEWLAEHKRGFSTESAEALRQELKDAMRKQRAEIGSHQVIEQLRGQGLDRAYAQSLPSRILHPDFIAPQREETYVRVCRVLALHPANNAFALLRTLRTARRQAGLLLSTRIAERLDTIPDIPDMLRDSGAVLLSEPGVEGVALMVVRAIATEAVPVPAWRLGMALTQDGQTWHP